MTFGAKSARTARLRLIRAWAGITLPVLLAVGPRPAVRPAHAQDFSRYEFTATSLADDLSLLRGAGGAVLACAGPQGLLLVDTDYEAMAAKLAAAAAALDAGPVRCAVNTHWHYDHVGGNAALASAGAVIFAHASVRANMASEQHLDVLDQDVPPSPTSALPAVAVDDSLTLHWGDESVRLWHAAHAHTDGDLVVWFERADVVHVGDLLFNGGYPYIDTAHGGSVDGVITGLENVIARCGETTRVVCGHGPLASRQDLVDYVAMLRAFREAIATEIAAGHDLAQIQAMRPTQRLDDVWGQSMFPPALFTEIVWRSLQTDSR